MPKTIENTQQPQKSRTLDGSVDKIHQHRTTATIPRKSDHHLSELYQDLVKTAVETRNPSLTNCKMVYVNEVDRMRMTRDGFKQYTEESRKKVLSDLEAERQCKLNEAQKLQKIATLSKDILGNIKSIRQHTETVVEQTLSRCRSLCQQIGQPNTSENELNVKHDSIISIIKDLQR